MADSGSTLSFEEKWELISRDLGEIIGEDEIKETLKKRDLKVYWGTATTGKPHLAYFSPIFKIADFLKAGCHVTILFADLHGFLDNMKSTFELLEHRCSWYEAVIKEQLRTINVPLDKLRFIKGSTYQLSREYTLDVYKLSAASTTAHTKHAGADVVKKSEHPPLSGLLYPILQALDEHYLDVDVQFGGVDQRKIFLFARDALPKIGYRKRAHLMNIMIPSLAGPGAKMSASNKSSKVDLDDSPAELKKKFAAAYSEDGVVEGNGLLALMRYIMFRFLESTGKPFLVKRKEKWGGDVTYGTYEELEDAFISKQLASGDLKSAVSELVTEFLAPLRAFVSANVALHNVAYPDAAIVDKPVPRMSPGNIEVRVGLVQSVREHADSDKLFVSEVDVGKAHGGVRTIVSGLRPYMSADDLQGSRVLVACNLAEKKLRGQASHGMLLCAAIGTKDRRVQLLRVGGDDDDEVPVGTLVSWKGEHPGVRADMPHISAKKLGKVLKMLKVNDAGLVVDKEGNQAIVNGTNIKSEVVGGSIA